MNDPHESLACSQGEGETVGRRNFLLTIFLSAFAGELGLLLAVAFGGISFLAPEGLNAVKDRDSLEAIFGYAAGASIYYAAEFMFIGLISCLVCRHWTLSFWPRCILGACLFAAAGILLVTHGSVSNLSGFPFDFALVMAASGFAAHMPMGR